MTNFYFYLSNQNKILSFSGGCFIKIGKDPKSHIFIDEENMSRLHAVIEFDKENGATIIDLGNLPGTMVNNARINKFLLKKGDVISFGGKSFIRFLDKSIDDFISDVKQYKIESREDNTNKNYKIYITAAHSCGKSTLARYIAHRYEMNFISEVARMVLSEKELNLQNLRSNLDVTDDYQWAVFERQLEEEKKYDSFVSDRCFDFLAYSSQHARIGNKIFQDEKFQNYMKSLKEENVIIFFVRPSRATLAEDGIRENLSWDGIIAIDAQIKMILELYGIKYFQINSDSLQERVNLVDNVLSLFFT